MDLAVSCHALCRALRRQGEVQIASQLIRAATSIPLNIAEGKGRAGPREFARFLTIALGSLREVETLIMLIGRLGLAARETLIDLLKQADEVGRVLYGLESATRKSIRPARMSRDPESRQPKPTTDS